MSALRSMVVFGVISSGNGCGPDYDIKPIDPGPGANYGTCDPEADANALPEARPVAVCTVNPLQVLPIHESATFLGAESYDPNGLAITDYHWRLVARPEGSAAELPDHSAFGPFMRSFTPDLVGDYVVELVVENEECVRSEPCEVVLNGRPTQNLWIEMFWEYPGDDMDLHLVQNGGAYTTTDDCFYGNCVGGGPNWGDPEGYDDPALDLDDIPGVGPENINITDPADGRYTVSVHDYPGSVYYAPNDVTVRIYVDGALAWQATKTISGEDLYVPFAEITWPEGVIEPR